MRERAFAVLGDRVVGVRLLDLFAGTGCVGLEALSRGAAAVVFVERHAPTARILRINCTLFELDADRAHIIVRPVKTALTTLKNQNRVFQVVWADPPFERWQDGPAAAIAAFDTGLLDSGGLACLECPARADVAAHLPASLEVERDLRGGASRVVIVRRAHAGDASRTQSP
jgi:16S rRNA (guanine966-N2)-methyltransferase